MTPIFRSTIRTPARGTTRAQLAMENKLLRAMWNTTDIGAQQGKDLVRADMAGAGLGRLAGAIGAGSDKRRGRVHRTADGFKVSGDIHVRGRSERTLGAIEIYSEGGEIVPTKGWLWIATPEIPARAQRRKMTPALYNATGLAQRIGPLVKIDGRHPGEALLIVRNVTVDRFGRAGRARRLPKRGAIGASRERVDFIIAFVGIRRTSRGQRIEPRRVAAQAAANQPRILAQELRNVR
ncbi:hypothetical protein HRJ34_14910 [Rhizorhabdus wittichii]|uniref:Uncharacterized protein n=1 Tax=Rhizorhabdus wittichii TaxID=160791 RepID=A0A975HDF0_9SPHN|nr:hypothetical protein [Rhizorhabdus wittichii]QTH19664.1 hypothetical protein HRJ34_14910 [Rhizorhabdus wittichii]